MQISKKEQGIISYLLGQATDAEQARIEQACFHDSAYHEQILALEDELIHEYLRGQLSATERKLFEQHFLASERRRKKYEFTQNLMDYADKVLVRNVVVETAPWWSRLIPFQPKLVWATVGSLLVVGGSVWWMSRAVPTGTEKVGNVQMEQVAGRQQASSGESQPVPSGQIAEPPKSAAPENNGQKSPTSKLQKVFAVTLASFNLRSGEALEVNLPAGYESIEFRIPVNEYPSFSKYGVTLKTTDGGKVVQQSHLKKSSKTEVVSVTVPSRQISGKDYVLALFGEDTLGSSQMLSETLIHIKTN